MSRAAYVQKLKRQLDKWNADLDTLEVKAREAQAGAAGKLKARLADARKHRDEAAKRMAQVGSASEDAWEVLKHGTEEAWARMSDAFSSAWAAFRKAGSKDRAGAKATGKSRGGSAKRTSRKVTPRKKSAKRKTGKKKTARARGSR